jgi:hypothetical protein
MKKSAFLLLVFALLTMHQVNGQKGGLLKKVANSMTNELMGKPENSNNQPEPSCACDKAELVMAMDGKLKLDYRELSISILDDGRILAKHMGTFEYYIVKAGTPQGPYKANDPQLADFAVTDDSEQEETDTFIKRNKPYISKDGDKLIITFGGKKYGPYAHINEFIVSKSKDRFTALVFKNEMPGEDDDEIESEAKEMEEAIKNAKSDQERINLAMEFSQRIQISMDDFDEPFSAMPELITNIPNAIWDPLIVSGGVISGDIKFDDIVVHTNDNKIIDLKGNTLITLGQDIYAESIFINSDNTKYAYYDYGTLTFSDKTTMSDLFNPRLVKTDGKVYIAYMYYSPKKNAIMQCNIPF